LTAAVLTGHVLGHATNPCLSVPGNRASMPGAAVWVRSWRGEGGAPHDPGHKGSSRANAAGGWIDIHVGPIWPHVEPLPPRGRSGERTTRTPWPRRTAENCVTARARNRGTCKRLDSAPQRRLKTDQLGTHRVAPRPARAAHFFSVSTIHEQLSKETSPCENL
jgi:hypothetical protein